VAEIPRGVLIVVLVLIAAVIDAVLFDPMNLPGSPPNLLLLVVAAIALVLGPVGGAVTGFFAGLVADVLPPADHLIGRYALVLCVAGYVVGLFRDEARDSVFFSLAAVAAAAAVATLLYGALGGILGDARIDTHAILGGVPFSILYDVLLAPFVVPWVMSLARRAAPQVTRT
jgi:rod shape-determining protein MreD